MWLVRASFINDTDQCSPAVWHLQKDMLMKHRWNTVQQVVWLITRQKGLQCEEVTVNHVYCIIFLATLVVLLQILHSHVRYKLTLKVDLTWLDLIHPTSTWTYWATLWCHSCLLRAATSASSQVSPIPRKSFLTMPLQFVLGRPGPLLKPGTSQVELAGNLVKWCWSKEPATLQQSNFLPFITT